MTPTQASKIVGCSPQQVRTLIRTEKMAATKKELRNGKGEPCGYEYKITKKEAERVRDLKGDGRGYPRGKPRRIGAKDATQSQALEDCSRQG